VSGNAHLCYVLMYAVFFCAARLISWLICSLGFLLAYCFHSSTVCERLPHLTHIFLLVNFMIISIGTLQSPVDNASCTVHCPCAYPGPFTRHVRQINQSRNGRDGSHRRGELWTVSQSRYYVDEADSQAERVMMCKSICLYSTV